MRTRHPRTPRRPSATRRCVSPSPLSKRAFVRLLNHCVVDVQLTAGVRAIVVEGKVFLLGARVGFKTMQKARQAPFLQRLLQKVGLEAAAEEDQVQYVERNQTEVRVERRASRVSNPPIDPMSRKTRVSQALALILLPCACHTLSMVMFRSWRRCGPTATRCGRVPARVSGRGTPSSAVSWEPKRRRQRTIFRRPSRGSGVLT